MRAKNAKETRRAKREALIQGSGQMSLMADQTEREE
jgi:hypothetical protein